MYHHVWESNSEKDGTTCGSLSATFSNFVPLYGYNLHVLFYVIVVLGFGYVSLKYQSKVTSLTALKKPLTIVCVCYVSTVFALLVEPLKDSYKIYKNCTKIEQLFTINM